jgi:cytochrome c biogenesis protein
MSLQSSSTTVTNPSLGFVGWLRWFWRQLTSMRTALLLLLLLAIAAIPGSLVPQRAADPNGVTQYFANNEELAPVLDAFQLFDVYSSAWFSAIYLLLFVSLIGCVVPRVKYHWDALRSDPPRTPANLNRLPAHTEFESTDAPEVVIENAHALLKRQGYRAVRYDSTGAGKNRLTVSAERGYVRETGNLLFHGALVGVLIAVGFGGGFGFAGQRVIYEGQAFTNTLLAYDSFNPGRWFSASTLTPYTVTLDSFTTVYEEQNQNAIGQPTDYTANVTTQLKGEEPTQAVIKVNEPLRFGDTDIYLLGNGYAPQITVRDADGGVVFRDTIPFLPQDTNLTSVGVVKLPDGLPEQLGLVGFFYPTVSEGHSGAYFSMYPDLIDPLLSFNVWKGDLGLNEGVPRSVYALDTTSMTKLTGQKTSLDSLEMRPGETVDLPEGLGSVTFDGVKKFVSLDIHNDPAQGWVLVFALLSLGSLLFSLFIPRRRIWVAVSPSGSTGSIVQIAALARGDDATLGDRVRELSDEMRKPSQI